MSLSQLFKTLETITAAAVLALAFAAMPLSPLQADEATKDSSKEDMSAGEALDQMGEDASKAGDAAVKAAGEAADSVAEGAEDAYDWSKKQVEEVTK